MLIRLSLATIILLALVVATQFDLVRGDDDQREASNSMNGFKFSNLFDFGSFKKLFHKSYKSPTEETNRQKTFTSNLLRSFISKVAYKHKTSEAYMQVNSMSDWSAEEFDSILIDPKSYLRDAEEAEPGNSANLASLIVNEIELNSNSDSDSDSDSDWDSNEDQAKQHDDHSKHKDGRVIKTNVTADLRKLLKKVTKFKLSSLPKKVTAKSIEAFNNVEGFMWRAFHNLPKRTDLPDEVFIDHRESGCLLSVKNQRQCGSCYVFSTMALYEWAYCRLTGKQVRFSEQYVLDCGKRMRMRGCKGGVESWVAKFIGKYGFESMNDIYYLGKEAVCPYDKLEKSDQDKEMEEKLSQFYMFAGHEPIPDELGEESMGLYRMDRPKLISVGLSGVEKQLRISPVIIAVKTSGIFQQYGGGVDMGRGCEKKLGLHSVLIVGSGRENGIEYWLIRNSFGSRWGEQGHWKLAKNNNCYTIGNSGMSLKALDYHQAPKQLVNSTAPLIELQQSSNDPVIVYNFTENPKHNRKFVSHAIARIMDKTGPVYFF